MELANVSNTKVLDSGSENTKAEEEELAFEGSTHSYLCSPDSSWGDRTLAVLVLSLQLLTSVNLISWSAKLRQKDVFEEESADYRPKCSPDCTTFNRDWLGDMQITMEKANANSCDKKEIQELSVRDDIHTGSGEAYYTTEYVYWSASDNVMALISGLIILSAFFLEPMQSNWNVFRLSKNIRRKTMGLVALFIDILLFISGTMMLIGASGEGDFLTLVGGPVGLLFLDDLDEKVFEAIGGNGSARTLAKIVGLSVVSFVILAVSGAMVKEPSDFFNICNFSGEW
jgi:hypothetical protein